METLETGASNAGAEESETQHTEQTDENANGGTSTDGSTEDADDVETLKKRIADKDAHIARLETEKREMAPKKTPKPAGTVSEDDALWIVENADALKMCKPEYQAYISKGYSRQDALRLAKLDKGLIKSDNGEAKRQVETTTPVQGEHRATKSKVKLTPQQIELGITEEMIGTYGPEVEKKIKR